LACSANDDEHNSAFLSVPRTSGPRPGAATDGQQSWGFDRKLLTQGGWSTQHQQALILLLSAMIESSRSIDYSSLSTTSSQTYLLQNGFSKLFPCWLLVTTRPIQIISLQVRGRLKKPLGTSKKNCWQRYHQVNYR
jgi:hypothetical protein